MRRFWQKQRTVAVKGILSYFAGESTATKPAKPACIERQRQIKQKNSYKRNASFSRCGGFGLDSFFDFCYNKNTVLFSCVL